MARSSDFVSTYRQSATNVLSALQAMKALHDEARIMNYPTALKAADFAGANADIDITTLTAAAVSMASILTTLNDAALLSLYKIRT